MGKVKITVAKALVMVGDRVLKAEPGDACRVPWTTSSGVGLGQTKPLFTQCLGISLCQMWVLLLSRFSRVRLCATPQTAAYQAPPSLGFSRQEHWSGLPFPSPMREGEVAQSCPTLRNSMDCSLPGSSIHGIFPARVLEWGAIAFSRNTGESVLNQSYRGSVKHHRGGDAS